MFINIDLTKSSTFDQKIIYAPNGFGKTQNAHKIQDFYNKNNEDCILFTQQDIAGLFSFAKNKIYFGLAARYEKRIDEITSNFDADSPLKDIIDNLNDGTSLSEFCKKSFYFKKKEITSLTDFNKFSRIVFDQTQTKSANIINTLNDDLIIDFNLYNDISDFINKYDGSFSNELEKKDDKNIIDNDIEEKINALEEFVISRSYSTCPLCGNKSRSTKALVEKIDKQKANYKVDNDNFFVQLDILLRRVTRNVKDLKGFIVDKTIIKNSKYQQLKVVLNYFKYCDLHFKEMNTYISNIAFDGSHSLKAIVKECKEDQIHIDEAYSNIDKRKNYNNFIKKQFELLFNDKYEIIQDKRKQSFSIFSNGRNVKIEDVYKYFSESESKRLCLVIMEALIQYGRFKSIVLDDPVDSYDDYYTFIASKYIQKIIKSRKVKNWVIFTNNLNFINYLCSEYNNYKYIFYSYNFNIFDKNPSFSVFHDEFANNEVGYIFKSEPSLLEQFYKSDNNNIFDEKLALISFLPTLRNIRDLYIKNFPKLKLSKESHPINKDDIKGNEADIKEIEFLDNSVVFYWRISNIVEHQIMHYSEENGPKLRDIIDIYKMVNDFNSKSKICDLDLDIDFCKFRESVVKQNFSDFTGNKLLDIIFLRISLISYLKYYAEEKIFNRIKSIFIKDELDEFIRTNSLGGKIGYIEGLNSKYKDNYAYNTLVRCLENVTKFSVIYNNFDHSLNSSLPPYLSVSLIELRNFYLAIEEL